MANNLIAANRGTAVRTAGSVGTTFSKTIAHLTGTAQPGTADPKITHADPNLAADGELSRPSTGSVVVDHGRPVSGVTVTDDLDGQTRGEIPDAGCDEVSTAPRVRGPFTLSSSLVRVNRHRPVPPRR